MKQLDLFTGEESDYKPDPIQYYSNFETPQDLGLLLARLNIVEVGLFYLGDKMKKRPISPNYQGLCPFHNERTPSFYLKPNKNRYVCYGCGISGGPLSLDYKLGERIYSSIAQKAGIDDLLPSLPELHLSPNSQDMNDTQKRYIEVISKAFERENYHSPILT